KEGKGLHQAAEQFADPIVRNSATVGGNLVDASPAADMAVPLLALDASLKIESVERKRDVRLKDFFIGPEKTILREDEMITGIEFESSNINKNGCFIKLGLRKLSFFTINSEFYFHFFHPTIHPPALSQAILNVSSTITLAI
ncbi:unnamed protein product, partial [marine sediment metagenome]